MLVSRSGLRLLDSQNGILGCLAEAVPAESTDQINLDQGDRLLLYTDGLVEVFNSSGEMLGVAGLEKLVLEAAKLTLPKMRQAILEGVTEWTNGPLADDVSLVIIEVC